MRLVDYIGFKIDKAVMLLLDDGKSKDECACYLMDFKKQLFKPDEVIVDEDKTKYLNG